MKPLILNDGLLSFARPAAAANSGRNLCWFTFARKQVQFFFLPLLLSKWRYLFQPFDGGRGSRKSIFSSTRAGRWNFNALGRRGLQLERYLQAVPVGSVRHASPRWPGSAVGAVNISGSLGRDCSEAFCQVSCIVSGIRRGLWHAAFRYCFPHTLSRERRQQAAVLLSTWKRRRQMTPERRPEMDEFSQYFR